MSQQFLLLAGNAHPSYHAVVQEYYQLTLLLARGKTKGLSRRFTRVVSYRAVVDSQGRDMDDYLNWFEATQLRSMSGAFSEILKNADDEHPDVPRRRDPISVYLDSIEAEEPTGWRVLITNPSVYRERGGTRESSRMLAIPAEP